MNTKGFTLIELMIVVALIGILSAIAIPKFAQVVRKSQEGTTKANLGALRSALAIYYADNEGVYPADDLTSLLVKYIREIPYERTPPYHPGGNVVGFGSAASQGANPGNWFFYSDRNDAIWGKIIVNCNHSDSRGVPWDEQ